MAGSSSPASSTPDGRFGSADASVTASERDAGPITGSRSNAANVAIRADKLSVGGSMDPEAVTATAVVAAVDSGRCGDDGSALSALAVSDVTGRVLSALARCFGVVAPD